MKTIPIFAFVLALFVGPIVILYASDNEFSYSAYMEYFDDIKGKKISFSCIDKENEIDSLRKIKIIKLINTGCTSCFKEMEHCQKIINENNFYRNFEIIFIASGEANEYFEYIVNQRRYEFRILADYKSLFLDGNNLDKYEFQTLLLNEKNEILLIGSPFENKNILRFYRYILKNHI